MLRLETFNKPANSAASSTSSETMISGIDNVAGTPLACAAANEFRPLLFGCSHCDSHRSTAESGLQTRAATGAGEVTTT
jgi:hypothetical protein